MASSRKPRKAAPRKSTGARLRSATRIVLTELEKRSQAEKQAAKKQEAQRAKIEALFDTEALSWTHDKLYEAQALCKVLHMTQFAEESGIELPDELDSVGICDVSLMVHRILGDVHSMLDRFEDNIGKPEAQKAEGTQEEHSHA
jgi:ribosomal protein L9